MKYLIVLFSIFCFSSCSTDRPAVIEFNLSNIEIDELIVGQINESIYAVVALENGKGSCSLAIDHPMIIQLKLNAEAVHTHNDEFYAHINPGEKVIIENGADSLSLEVNGLISAENKHLNKFSNLITKADNDYGIWTLGVVEPEAFLDSLERKYSKLDELIEKVTRDNQLSEHFRESLSFRLHSKKTLEIALYPLFYSRYHKKDPNITEDFLYPVHEINMSNPLLTQFIEGKSLVKEILYQQVDPDSFEDFTEYSQAMLSKIDTLFRDQTNRAYFSLSYFISLIDLNAGLNGLEGQVSSFRESTQNDYVLGSLDQAIRPWLKLEQGNKAPSFDGLTVDGVQVSLDDLVGKYVYVDIWATWCKPCIVEMPAFKELEVNYREKGIVFVGMSIDRLKYKEKWKSFVMTENLPGVQLHVEDTWESDLAINYNVKGIPRYLLIGPDGKIISANAPKPSEEKLKELLDSFLFD